MIFVIALLYILGLGVCLALGVRILRTEHTDTSLYSRPRPAPSLPQPSPAFTDDMDELFHKMREAARHWKPRKGQALMNTESDHASYPDNDMCIGGFE